MSEQPADPNFITAETLTEQLAWLSRLKNEFEQTKRECVGGEDSVSEVEFEAWLKSFGHVDEAEANDFPRYRRCMEAYEAFACKCNEIQFLPLTTPNLVVAELAHRFP